MEAHPCIISARFWAGKKSLSVLSWWRKTSCFASPVDDEQVQTLAQMPARDRAITVTLMSYPRLKEALVCMSSEDRDGTLEAMSAIELRMALPLQRGAEQLTEELQIDMQCFVSIELQGVIFGNFIPMLWILHGFFLFFGLASQLWLSTCKGSSKVIGKGSKSLLRKTCKDELSSGNLQQERMVTQGILVSCPITPIVVLFELGYGCSTMCFMFDLQFNHRVIIGYFVFALFNGAFMTYFMIIRPQQQGYQDKDHENYRKLDPR